MRKNKMMRAASALLVAVLLTTSVISGTFAKYVTTASATDTARVAKWGVTVSATGDDAFAKKYDNTASDSGVKVVSETEVVAPGTNGPLGSITITGTPEVMVDVDVNATLTLAGWTYDHDDDPGTADVEYCPIIFTINGETYGTQDTTATNKSDNVADLKTDIEALFNKAATVSVGTNLATTYDFAISWSWPFEVGTGAVLDANDAKDTALGDKAADGSAPTITFACDATVTQVD